MLSKRGSLKEIEEQILLRQSSVNDLLLELDREKQISYLGSGLTMEGTYVERPRPPVLHRKTGTNSYSFPLDLARVEKEAEEAAKAVETEMRRNPNKAKEPVIAVPKGLVYSALRPRDVSPRNHKIDSKRNKGRKVSKKESRKKHSSPRRVHWREESRKPAKHLAETFEFLDPNKYSEKAESDLAPLPSSGRNSTTPTVSSTPSTAATPAPQLSSVTSSSTTPSRISPGVEIIEWLDPARLDHHSAMEICSDPNCPYNQMGTVSSPPVFGPPYSPPYQAVTGVSPHMMQTPAPWFGLHGGAPAAHHSVHAVPGHPHTPHRPARSASAGPVRSPTPNFGPSGKPRRSHSESQNHSRGTSYLEGMDSPEPIPDETTESTADLAERGIRTPMSQPPAERPGPQEAFWRAAERKGLSPRDAARLWRKYQEQQLGDGHPHSVYS
eukprot:TRINITY_DN11928_c0_g1_i1.p1 TRINITY_DN11928_c0_g1~~TRINITY_DN11928_c0_g1_i1.p1  ORF type:complete len:439 (-),score=36.24 TRINITY_DN11928_c0_g1_i1:11-1327(-)